MSERALADRPVEPATGDDEPLGPDEYDDLDAELRDDVWMVVDDHHLEGEFVFDDFRGALEFTYEVGELAEQEWHHPDLRCSWGEVVVELWTHDVGGLTEADFVMAAKMDRVYEAYEAGLEE